jgi:hypothetical protein
VIQHRLDRLPEPDGAQVGGHRQAGFLGTVLDAPALVAIDHDLQVVDPIPCRSVVAFCHANPCSTSSPWASKSTRIAT